MTSTGLDKLIQDIAPYRGRKAALIVNHTSVTKDFLYSWKVLPELGLDVQVIFSPEHGLFGTEQDQIPVEKQPVPGIETVSLYGSSYDTLIPDASCLDGLDCIIFDIQDVGSRYYTYINTMLLVMKEAAGKGIEFIVLDRPNPIGSGVEGPVLSPEFESFVGLFPVAVRHGLTAGELALLGKKQFHIDIEVTVIKMSGWERNEYFEHTGLPWIPPSPNMPQVSTAAVYPGMCLFEGLNVSEGRGTTRPFEFSGADFIDADRYCELLNGQNLPGVIFQPFHFIPVFHKYKEKTVHGTILHVTDREAFRPFLTGVVMASLLYREYRELKFLYDVYEFNSEHPTFDLLCGTDTIRGAVEEGADIDELRGLWAGDEKEFIERRKDIFLY